MNIDRLRDEVYNAFLMLGGGVLGVGYKNLVTGETLFFDERHVFPAASIIKIPIMMEYFRQKEKGLLSPDEIVNLSEEDVVGGAGILLELHRGIPLTLQDLVHLMIVISDNTASNMLIDRLGMDNINDIIKEIGLSDTVIGRKLMIDPNAMFSKNFTSAADCVKMMEILYKGEYLSEENSQEALEIMSRQQYREKIPLYLPKNLKIANKTGEISGVRHDCAIVYYEASPYILCFLTEELPDVIKGDQVLSELSRIFFAKIARVKI